MKVRKAVIPAAGLGTKFLPATKSLPKEMIPIVDKPVIQYVVEECVASGIQDIIMVTGYHKRSIEDHFDIPSRDLIENLEAGGEKKRPLLNEVMAIGEMANFIYIRQKGGYGNATPVKNAQSIIGDEPFAVLWGDEFIYSEVKPRLKQCLEVCKIALVGHGGLLFGCGNLKDTPDLPLFGRLEITETTIHF